MTFISHPTHVLKQFLEKEQGLKPRTEFTLGRLSMALEVITVIKTLEDELVPMLSLQRQEMISVLQTLLIDQDLAETAMEWYEALTLWRRPVFSGSDASHEDSAAAGRQLAALASAAFSQGGGLQHARVLADSTRALPDMDRSLAPASDVSAPQQPSELESTPSESDGSSADSEDDQVAFLRQSRSRRGTRPE